MYRSSYALGTARGPFATAPDRYAPCLSSPASVHAGCLPRGVAPGALEKPELCQRSLDSDLSWLGRWVWLRECKGHAERQRFKQDASLSSRAEVPAGVTPLRRAVRGPGSFCPIALLS